MTTESYKLGDAFLSLSKRRELQSPVKPGDNLQVALVF